MDENERQRKLEAGRAKLASFRQKRAKGGGTGPAKKASKGQSTNVPPQNDCTTQDGHIDAAPPSANGKEPNTKHHEVDKQPKQIKVKQKNEVDSSPSPDRSPMSVEGLKDEDLATLTSKDQLKLLQQAVEKRDEIISKLTTNLQEALSSRDQVQLEAQTLAGQIQALRQQLQQTSMEFSRIKTLHGPSSDSDSSHKDTATEFKNEGSNTDSDEETTTAVNKLKLELENERARSQSIFSQLEKEQSAVLLLEEEKKTWEEELQRHLVQLQDLQSQCLETQQYKKDKEKLNAEVLELKEMLRGQDDPERFALEATNSALLVHSLQEELESVKQQLEDREKELRFREEEVMGLKASKNRQNQERAGIVSVEVESGDRRFVDDHLNGLQTEDVLMERYLCSEPPAHEDFQQCSQLSGDCSFELNSEVLGDHPLLSISARLEEVREDVPDSFSLSEPGLPSADAPHPLFQWLDVSQNDQLDLSQTSAVSGDAPLEKELLYQQCSELQEELQQKERELEVLREDVYKGTEELEEARSRWAQVTEELREALLELEEEKEKRIQVEEQMQQKREEQDELQNKDGALEECAQSEPVDLLMFSPQQSGEKAHSEEQQQTLKDLIDNQKSNLEETKKELQMASELVHQRALELENALKDLQSSQTELLNLQAKRDDLLMELDQARASLDRAEKERHDLESQMVCLNQNMANLEETQTKVTEEREELRRKGEEMGERINTMEQVLEEELEQFENLLKSKDAEMAEEREKWEEERQEKEKEISDVKSLLEDHRSRAEEELNQLRAEHNQAVEEAVEMVKKSYQQEILELKKKHQQETSGLEVQFDNRLVELQFTLEEEQKRQINLIKQVTEREHERMMAELSARHAEELEQMKTELSLELRESMEAAHQAEMNQAQAQKMLEMEALRLNLINSHHTQLEPSQDTAVGTIQASMKETFTQERALIQAKHQMEVDQIRRHHQEEQERTQQLHQSDMDKLKRLLDEDLSKEKTYFEQQATQEKQPLMSQLEEAHTAHSNLQAILLEKLNKTKADLDSALASLDQMNEDYTKVQASLTQLRLELKESEAKLDDYQTSSEEQSRKLTERLQQALCERDAATCSLEELLSSHKAALQDKEQQVLLLQVKEEELQQQVLNLQKEKSFLKQNSQEEVDQLWTQLESMRTNRQELGELKEQLRARSSQVEDIERLKVDFNEQKLEIKQQNEAELESLRRYFEKRLQAAEEGYREEIALLQLRMVEGALEESVLKTVHYSEYSKCLNEEEKEIDDKQELEEKHTEEMDDLRSSLSESFKEEIRQVRSDLTDQYYSELEEMKSRHALEMEQVKAKLSESHLRALTRIQLDAARQIEVEVEQRLWFSTEEQRNNSNIIYALENRLSALSNQHKAEVQSTLKLKEDFAAELVHLEDALQKERAEMQERLTTLKEELQQQQQSELRALREEFEKEKAHLERTLQEENNKLRSLQAALECDNGPPLLKVQQRLETQFENELQKAQGSMEEEVKVRIQQAQERFQEEKAELERNLSQKYELCLSEVKEKHKSELAEEKTRALTKHSQEMDSLTAKYTGQLDALSTSHREQLAAMASELQSKHNAELVALEAALHSQRKIDLASLEAAFQETSQAQLEAQLAQLESRHQEEKDELERRMLGNMDTLEATYLKEVQTLRDEMMHLEERHCGELMGQKHEHEQMLKRTLTEQQSLREQLSQQLSDRISAMAAELTQAHKVELSCQKEALDNEHCQALEALKQQVLELEQQHSAALQELTSTYAAEVKQLTEPHQVQLQELKNISARELEACRRELEESSSRQRQHFTEEVELLKAQSEERLQDRLRQIKTEFEEQKEAELEELRRSHTSEQEEREASYTSKMSQLTAQLQQLDAVVAQLREEVGCLQGELEGKRSEMETLDSLLQRRERESQEGGNLLKMLTDDLQAAKREKITLLSCNEKLRRVFVEMVRSTIATEELIGQKVSAHDTTSAQVKRRSSVTNKDAHTVYDLSSEDLELTHTLCESLLVSDSNLTLEGEEAALSASGRLHRAVSTLLDLLNQANTQLEETHNVHLSLEQKFTRGRDDSAQLVEQHKLLIEQLNEEAKQKSQLQLELHKAEGLVQGFVAEKAILEESLQQKEAQEERLAEELEDLKLKLHQTQNLAKELEMLRCKNQELSEEHAALLRQKEHLSADLGDREKALLTEVEHLAQDRADLQRQAEKDHSSLSQRIRALERELEDQETRGLETEQHNKALTDDLHQRVQALEKQLKHNRHFIEEQAVEREHERDEFQQEIKKLEDQLKQTTCTDNKGLKFEDMVFEVENLQAMIKDKTEDHATLLSTNQQFQRDLAERNEEIDKLAGRIRELEQALLNSAETSRTANQLEQELHKAMLREQELTQDKQALEQQQLSHRLQISALQSKLDETKHCHQKNSHDPTQELREALDTAQQNLHCKEQEVEELLGQLETVQSALGIKEVELKHLTLQLESITTRNTAHVTELQEQIAVLQDIVSTLTILEEQREEEPEVVGTEDTFPTALLLEKNLEIDQLHNEIQRLEQEQEQSSESKTLETEQLRSQVDDLRSQVEHLQSEALRIRHDKQEEAERLHEIISTLQAELNTLGPNLHEVSDSQDGDSINPSPAPSPEPPRLTLNEPERVRPNNLKQELGVSYPASTRSLRSRLKALQSQLEIVGAEKEGLERLLHTQEQEYRGHGEEMAKRLKAQVEKAEELQNLLNGKINDLERLQIQMDEREERLKSVEVEINSYKSQAHNVNDLQGEIQQFRSIVKELQSKQVARSEEIEALKAKEQRLESEMGDLRERGVVAERKLQETLVELVRTEALVAEERSKVTSLEAAVEERAAEQKGMRGREVELLQEIKRLKQEVEEMRRRVQELMGDLRQKEQDQEVEQKDVLSHAEQTLFKADAVLKEKEVEHRALSNELNAVKRDLQESTETAEKLQKEAHAKEKAVADLEFHNRQLKAQLQKQQEDLVAQEEELVHHRKGIQTLRLRYQHDQSSQQQTHKDSSHTPFEDVISSSHDDVSLSSPEVLRRLECSLDRFPERLHTSGLESRLSELSVLNNTSGLDLPPVKPSPRVLMEPAHSRTITPEPVSRSSHSPVSGSNYSTMESLDTDKVQELEELDLTTPSSPIGSTSSLSAPEWASDGYGSNVSSDLGARLRAELEQTERLDAQFVEYLRCRGINPTANTDSAAGSMSFSEELLSPELQALLRKVYQESCRILTLSQRHNSSHATGSDMTAPQRSLDGSSLHQEDPNPPMSWQQEKRALQETVIALRELLCRMAQRHNADGSGQLQDAHMELQLRAELEERQKEVHRAHNIQQDQKNKIETLRTNIEDGEDALRRERSKVQMLQQELEQERTRSLRKDIEDGDRREADYVSSELQRSELVALRGQLEQESVACSNLRRELQIEQSRSVLLEKHLVDLQRDLEETQKLQDSSTREKSQLEHLLNQTKSRLDDSCSELADAHRKLEEEKQRSSKQLQELELRHQTDAARDGKFISDLRAQLAHERRRSEELASEADRLRADLLQSRRRWEDEDKALRDEVHTAREAAARQKVALDTLTELKQDACRELEERRSLAKHQDTEITELKEKLQIMKNKEREREEQWERERRRGQQEQAQRDKRQQNTYCKLRELEELRQQDQQRLQELQRTLAELERDERELARQRLAELRTGHSVSSKLPDKVNHKQQELSVPSSALMEKLSIENRHLKEQLSAQSHDAASLKQKISSLSQQLRRTEKELHQISSETENRPAHEPLTHPKLQRLYERYLRAESFRKALVYQKRYLLLLIGGFQHCEQATLCLIATMGARPSSHLSLPLRGKTRFRTAVRVVIAISRMKFLTRKWQKAIRTISLSGSVHGPSSGSKAEVLRPQRSNSESASSREIVTPFVPSRKQSFRLHTRSQSSSTLASVQTGAASLDQERSLTEYIQHLEKVQHRLAGVRQGSPVHQPDPKKSSR
ncbi:unnamed protein product [Knipowitschia caucasica]|uniref:ELK domain-containing protein n=1 Tax=Knipowitschia caucasica TaxID=637954 RepID=A0AAV2JG57_KNICA